MRKTKSNQECTGEYKENDFNMKKIFILMLTLAVLLVLILMACENNQNGESTASDTVDTNNQNDIGVQNNNGETIVTAPITVLEIVSDLEFDYVGEFREGLAFVKKDGKWGFIDKKGNIVIPCIYDLVGEFNEGLAPAQMREESYIPVDYYDEDGGEANYYNWGFIDKNGNVIVPFIYAEVGNFSDGLARVGTDDGVGFIDTSGNVIIPCEYNDYFVRGFNDDGLVRLCKINIYEDHVEEKYGYADKSGNIVIPVEYDWLGFFGEDWVEAVKDGKMFYIDKDCNVMLTLPDEYSFADPFHDGLAAVGIYENNAYKIGYIDKMGNVVVPLEYGLPSYSLKDGYVAVRQGEKYGLADVAGNFVLPLEYDYIGGFNDGLLTVHKGDEWYYMDTSFNIVRYWEYEYEEQERDGLFRVRGNEKFGYINITGKIIIPVEYDNATYWGEVINLKKDGKWGFADINGNILSPCIYDDIQIYYEGLTAVQKDGKWGFIDNEIGVLTVALEYDTVNDFNEGLASVKKDGKWGIIEIIK